MQGDAQFSRNNSRSNQVGLGHNACLLQIGARSSLTEGVRSRDCWNKLLIDKLDFCPFSYLTLPGPGRTAAGPETGGGVLKRPRDDRVLQKPIPATASGARP